MAQERKIDISYKGDMETVDNFKLLIKNIRLLKDKTWGCPWQKSQTHKSLIPFLSEEIYEFTYAVYDKNNNDMCNELGDLLLQIMLHSEISFENKEFELKDVLRNLNLKIVSRHPYVFKNKEKVTLKQSKKIWENIKYIEKAKDKEKLPICTELKEDIKRLPANSGANKITEKVKEYGFKWEKYDEIINKLNEEINELQEAIKTDEKLEIQEEFGDIYFTLISLANFLNINPEESLHKANKKFLERFSIIEEKVGDNIDQQSSHDFKKLWQIAKKTLYKNSI